MFYFVENILELKYFRDFLKSNNWQAITEQIIIACFCSSQKPPLTFILVNIS